MKNDIHPQYHAKITVQCSCGNSFATGATVEGLKVEVCSNCHPFYTGKQKLLDTAGRVDKFRQREKTASTMRAEKKAKKTSSKTSTKSKAKGKKTAKIVKLG